MAKTVPFKILIADDEVEICDLLAEEFRKMGYTVFTAPGGNDAWKIIVRRKVDLVISDVRMPNGDGLKLLEKINNMATDKRPTVLMVSGFSELSKSELIERGADDLIEKPVDFQILLETVDQYSKVKADKIAKKKAA